MDLFSLSDDDQAAEAPLAARMRPRTLAEFVGQDAHRRARAPCCAGRSSAASSSR